MPLPDHAVSELAAMDAALRGESVDPEFAEVAELALMLAATRPEVSADRAYRLDLRVNGLASVSASASARGLRARLGLPAASEQRRPWIVRPAVGAGLAAVAAVVVAVVLVAGRGSSTATNQALFSPHKGVTAAATTPAVSSASGASSAGSLAPAAAPGAKSFDATTPTVASGPTRTAGSAASPTGTHATQGLNVTPTPESNGRRTIESAQLTLTTPGARIATVSQEVFNVVGAEQGVVKHSQVNSGAGASASFTLQVPSSNLAVTLARLAQLRYASVSSSSSSTADVNSQYLDDARALTDAKDLRTSLLTQLAAAITTAAVDSLKAQIRDAEATITSDERSVNRLNGRIAYTPVTVQIDTGSVPVPVPPASSHRGFTISRAAHDALTVLAAVGGGLLIALAVLIPLGLLAAVLSWGSLRWRRRRRERALDGA